MSHSRMKRSLWRVAGLPPVLLIALSGCARQEAVPRREALRAKLANAANPPRRIYPYSLIPGGVTGEEEFRAHRLADSLLTAHYRDIGQRLFPITMPGDRWMFASYRIDNAVFWTKAPILLRAGEPVLTDGANLVRGRCGNRLSDTPQTPVRRFEPPGLNTEAPPGKTISVPVPPSIAPVPGQPVSLPGLSRPPAPERPAVRVPPAVRLPIEQPTLTGPELFPATTAPPGILFPIPRQVPEVNKPLPHPWSPPTRPVAAVPEPSTWVLLSFGLCLMAIRTVLRHIRPKSQHG